jgi:hypothetical protein
MLIVVKIGASKYAIRYILRFAQRITTPSEKMDLAFSRRLIFSII